MAERTEFVEHFPDGRLKCRGFRCGSVLDGPLETYSPAGHCLLAMNYVNGVPDGPAAFRDDEGQLLAELEFAGGRQHGEARIYDGGVLSTRQRWTNGELTSAAFLDSQGRKLRELEFRGGKLHGRSVEFFPSGAVKEATMYEAGLSHGESIEYREDGKLSRRRCFAHGKPVKCPRRGWL